MEIFGYVCLWTILLIVPYIVNIFLIKKLCKIYPSYNQFMIDDGGGRICIFIFSPFSVWICLIALILGLSSVSKFFTKFGDWLGNE